MANRLPKALAPDVAALFDQLDDGPYERLDQIMAEKGVDNRELARRAGFHESAISRGINEHHGLDRHWPRLAVALDCSLNWLMFAKGPVSFTEATTSPVVTPPMTQAARELQDKINALSGHHAALGDQLAHLCGLLGEAAAPGAEPSSIPDQQPATGHEPPDDDDSPGGVSLPLPASPPHRRRRG